LSEALVLIDDKLKSIGVFVYYSIVFLDGATCRERDRVESFIREAVETV